MKGYITMLQLQDKIKLNLFDESSSRSMGQVAINRLRKAGRYVPELDAFRGNVRKGFRSWDYPKEKQNEESRR